MVVRLALEQAAVFAQHLGDMRVRVEHLLTGEQRRRRQEPPVPAHRVVDLEVVAAAHQVIVQSMTGGGVNRARARIERDVISQDDRHLPIVERVLQQQVLESGALGLGDHRPMFDAQGMHDRLDEFGRHDQTLLTVAEIEFDQGIVELWMYRHRAIGGEGPRRGGPNGHGGGNVVEQRQLVGQRESHAPGQVGTVHHFETHVDAG